MSNTAVACQPVRPLEFDAMVGNRKDSVAIAYQWASRIITVSLEMVFPVVLGHYLDRWLHTIVLFTVIGVIIGMTSGLVHLLQMTRSDSSLSRKVGANESSRPRSKSE